ncbi:hypothetical protein RA2_01209 [Roseovarius sp. A-2]|nr:hypothetical protein RA2_01209 [Roseovarius sp. A-2]
MRDPASGDCLADRVGRMSIKPSATGMLSSECPGRAHFAPDQ